MEIFYICHRFLGYGLFSIVDYDTWKPRRQLYDPAFRKRYDIWDIEAITPCHAHNIIFVVSYLKTLLIPFNEMVEKFLDQMQPLASGSTIVPMKVHFGEFTQDVISKVSQHRSLE
jgi:hypothetical protein